MLATLLLDDRTLTRLTDRANREHTDCPAVSQHVSVQTHETCPIRKKHGDVQRKKGAIMAAQCSIANEVVARRIRFYTDSITSSVRC